MDMNEVQLPENVVALHETEGSGLDGRGHGSTQDLSGSEVMPDVITPYGAAVDSAILDEIVTAIRKYLYILEQDALLLTLWCAHANIFRASKVTPRMIITAGSKECGKSVALTIAKTIVSDSFRCDDMTPASFFRLSEDGDKAFFIDEVDSWVKGEGRSVFMTHLKSGFQKGGSFIRVEGDGQRRKPRRFRTHSAVLLAGIGLESTLDPPVIDRSHVIHMRKAVKGDLEVRFDERKHLYGFKELGSKLLRWCLDNSVAIENSEPTLPGHLINRKADLWEPLFAIAEVAGGSFPQRLARIVNEQPPERDESTAASLLRDIRRIHDSGCFNETGIRSEQLAEELARLIDSDNYRPWARFHARKGFHDEDDTRIKGRDLNSLLKPYGISTKTYRLHDRKKLERGFQWRELLDTHKRHAQISDDDERFDCVTATTAVTDTCNTKTDENRGCNSVTVTAGTPDGGDVPVPPRNCYSVTGESS